jgi:sirohydrochlorin ferrochelatase
MPCQTESDCYSIKNIVEKPSKLICPLGRKLGSARKKNMNGLIIVAHGSRKKESARQVTALCEKISEKIQNLSKGDGGKGFDMVVPAFLQFSSPLLEDAIGQLVRKGALKIVVFPFFIAAGSHLLKDIPALIEGAGNDYPGVEFSITRHLGGIDSIEDIISNEVVSHLNTL